MTDYYRIRRFLGLRQLDVSLATGISVQRIALGERGLTTFNGVERGLVESYLKDKLQQFAIERGYIQANESSLEVVHAR